MQLLLTQKMFASAAPLIWQCSELHRSGPLICLFRADRKPPFGCNWLQQPESTTAKTRDVPDSCSCGECKCRKPKRPQRLQHRRFGSAADFPIPVIQTWRFSQNSNRPFAAVGFNNRDATFWTWVIPANATAEQRNEVRACSNGKSAMPMIGTGAACRQLGSRTTATNPPSGAFASVISPPWARMTLRAIASPSPAPPVSRLREVSIR